MVMLLAVRELRLASIPLIDAALGPLPIHQLGALAGCRMALPAHEIIFRGNAP